jgi:elongation factor P--(R)-beta-lysine ligase
VRVFTLNQSARVEWGIGDFGANHTDFAAKGQSSSTIVFLFLPRRPVSLPGPRPFWKKDQYAGRRGRLAARAQVTKFVRRWFDANGFIEVQPAALQASPGNETHLHGFRTALILPDGSPRDAYLHTSPEFAMKKLLAAGETQIYALTNVFRNRERTALHAPEFAMLEWYRTDAPLERLVEDCVALTALAAHVAGAKAFVFSGREASPFEPPERLTVRDAFRRHAGLDIYDSLPIGGRPDTRTLARQARDSGLRVAPDDDWSDIFSRLLSERVEPKLGIGRPTVLHAYPASEAALARLDPDDPRIAERFEFYCCGVELANAFHELTDPAEQRRRFMADMEEQKRIYGASAPIDEDFLLALAEMPEASGAALGFDRLVMLATGAESVESVQWTPVFDPGETGS